MESDILNEENKSKIHLVSKRLGFTIRRRREESKSKRKRRKKKEEERFKNQVCLCLRIKCIGFLGLGYGD